MTAYKSAHPQIEKGVVVPKSLFLVLLIASLALAQSTTHKSAKKGASAKSAASAPTVSTPDSIKWGDPPPILAPGAQFAVLSGNPTATGPYVIRLKMPDGYKIMPHWHPTTENVSVISGEFHVGMGDKFEESGMHALPSGSFVAMPPHMHHYGVAKGETVVQVHGQGPFKLTYVNPSDDPSKKK
jgi:anti-sigma factor ChrR (cupin superfamily)